MGQAAILTLAVGPAGRLLAGTRGQGVWQQQGSALYVTEGGWVALTRPGGPEAFAFSVSQAGDVLYVGSSAGGIVQQRIWHWWQRDRWVSRPRGGPAEGPVLAPAGPALVRVPAGEFEMGRPEAGQLVYVEGFWIDRFEVTWEVYCRQQVTDPACGSLTPETGALPATDLLWDEANAFCKAVGRQLPTGAQWEKAARGPDGRPYPWGDEAPKPDFANIFTGSIRIDPGTPEPMLEGIPPLLPPGSRPQGHSPYGAEDLAGNVWELIADGDSHRRPQNRGGAHTTRLTEELFINPEPYAVPTGDDLGFRCVRP
jgi:formylglycine-generating enzyme required for sulfatase activity